jgi:hypothetical protein
MDSQSPLKIDFLKLLMDVQLKNELLKSVYNKYFKRFDIDFISGEIKTKSFYYIILNFNDTFIVKISYEKIDKTIIDNATIVCEYGTHTVLISRPISSVTVCDNNVENEKIKNFINYYNDNIKQEFIPMLQFIDNYYKKLHETNHYANLKATLTFLLIFKNYEIGLHKDIAIIIAKKILFFYFCFLKLFF